MLKKIVSIIICNLIFIMCFVFTFSAYKSIKNAKINSKIAKPKVRIVSETVNVEELDLKKYTNEFSVVNYNENNEVSEIDLEYMLSVGFSKENLPISTKLYRINGDGNESEIELNKDFCVNEKFKMKSDNKTEDKYKLEMWFNLQNSQMPDDVEVMINLKAIQKLSIFDGKDLIK